jgi:hypothetical protein
MDFSDKAIADPRANARYDIAASSSGTVLGHVDNTQYLWGTSTVDETRWNKSYPYALLLLENKNGEFVRVRGQGFVFPLPPTSMSISTPYAITTSVTLGGVVEEHNGAPLRMISIQASPGIFPDRGGATESQSLGGRAVNSILGGTINGISRVGAATQIALQGRQTSWVAPNLVTDPEVDVGGSNRYGSGYYQFKMLRNYLEAYVNLKKTKKGSSYRLAFAIYKDNEAYLVSPVSMDEIRTSASPLEYGYTLQLKAWGRWVPNSKISTKQGRTPTVRDPSSMAGVLSRLQSIRAVVSSVSDVLTGFRADVDAVVLSPLREMILFVKDSIGVSITAADLPSAIVKDARNVILQASAVEGELSQASVHIANTGSGLSAEIVSMKRDMRDLANKSGLASTNANPSVSSKPQTHSQSLGIHESDPANNFFNNPYRYASLFDSFSIDSLNLRPTTARKIVDERIRVQAKTRLDFEKERDGIISFMADYADSVGVGANTYATLYSRAAPTSTKTPTDDDWDALFQLNQLALEMNRFAASTATDDRSRLSAMEYIAGQAGRSGMDFKVPASAYAVPFMYGSTLEIIAAKYLGDANRWNEIAVLNALRPPYVDEVGMDVSLTLTGNGNDVQVSDITNLYVGAPVWIHSNTVSREKRRITSISSLSLTTHIITLDGESDLAKFTTANQSKLFVFKPGTVNSLQLIYIPSDSPTSIKNEEVKSNPDVDEFENFLAVGGVDLLLTETGDLAITPDGDCRLATGLSNIIQKVKLAFNTPLGSLLKHPEYGFGVEVGASTADVSSRDILKAAKQTFADDPTFSGILSASVLKDGGGVAIGLNVGINGHSSLVPVSFRVRK